MAFEGKGKATWRDHPSINVKGNIMRSLPGLKYAVIAFGIYVTIDQLIRRSKSLNFIYPVFSS
jgi:ribosomal protein S12